MAITIAASRLGTSAFNETDPIKLRPNSPREEVKAVIQTAYRQILGNDYVMASERLRGIESRLYNGTLSVREFVRAIAKSELYKAKFLYGNSQTRVVELNFKHLLGRAPYDKAETVEHLDRYQKEGFEADIDSYLDSVEYAENFGEAIVPYYRGFASHRGQRTVGFTRMFRLYRGYANSDRAQFESNEARLTKELVANRASRVVVPSGSLEGWAYRSPIDSVQRDRAAPRTEARPIGSERQFYRLEVLGLKQSRHSRNNRTAQIVLVPCEELSSKLQQIDRLGGTIASVTLV
ncbi:MAG: phycobilisome linker polypeptide [Cyanobacteria bacterium SBLK]|nr:phycobilisome linker polypeptide [Cyanobacteria bacterium SBLK]